MTDSKILNWVATQVLAGGYLQPIYLTHADLDRWQRAMAESRRFTTFDSILRGCNTLTAWDSPIFIIDAELTVAEGL